MKPRLTRKAGNIMNGIKSNKDVWTINIYNRKNLIKLIESIKKYMKHKKRKTDMMITLNKIQYVGS